MEAIEMDDGREFECPHCMEISLHRCKLDVHMSVWCPRCKNTTEYHVRADGYIDVIGEE